MIIGQIITLMQPVHTRFTDKQMHSHTSHICSQIKIILNMSDSSQMVTSVRCARCSSEMLSHPAAELRHRQPDKPLRQCVVVRRSPAAKSPPPHLRPRPRDKQHVVPASGPLSRPGLGHSGEISISA